jgi:DNA-binding GntR family transcriptional regulator
MDDVVSIALVPLTQESAPLRRKIVAALRHAIEVSELKPGDRLVEKDLCQKLSVSRTSLREALRELQAEKLVVAVARGLAVAEISEEDAANIYQVRAALEGLVAAQFAEKANKLDVNKLVDALARLERAYRSGDFERILDEKKSFYDVICAGAGNAIVRDILDHLSTRINQLRSASRLNTKRWMASLAELKELASALFARNPKAARVAAIKHIDAAAKSASQSGGLGASASSVSGASPVRPQPHARNVHSEASKTKASRHRRPPLNGSN